MNHKISLVLGLVMLFSPSLWAKEDVDYLKIADSFSECSALQKTLADIIANKDEQHSKALKQAANDADIIAADFLEVGGYKKQRAKSQFDAHFMHFQSMLFSSKESYATFTDAVKPVVSKCAALHSLQTTLIAERRKQKYKSN